MLVENSYCYFDEKEKIFTSKEETLELLHATYGQGTLLDDAHRKAINIQCIKRLQNAKGNEEEQNADINYLKKEFLDPKIIDYIYHQKPELTAIEIYEKAIKYKPISL